MTSEWQNMVSQEGMIGIGEAREVLQDLNMDEQIFDNPFSNIDFGYGRSDLFQRCLTDRAILSICEEHTLPMRRAGKMLQLSYAGQSATKLQTGFEELDKQLEGGISKKGITQILGSPGCGKTTFIHGLIKHYLDNSKQKVIYLSPTDERAVLIKRVMKV